MCIISVIVPVYNSAEFLTDSMESLVNQTIFEKLEIIAVDDGSTDNSLSILRDFEKNYSNIKVFTQKNGGVSKARNTGLRNANGEYIAFFDSDDYAEKKLYEALLQLSLNYHADISIVDYSMVFPNGTIVKHRRAENYIWDNNNEIMKEYFKYNRVCPNPVDKLIRADLAKKEEFPEGYAIGEDMYYIYRILKQSNRVVLDSNNSYYRYILHTGSAMKSSFSMKNLDSLLLMKKILEEEKEEPELYRYVEAKYYNEVCKALAILVETDTKGEYINIGNRLKEELQWHQVFRIHKYMSKKHLMAYILMCISPHLYIYIYKLLKIG